MAVKNELDVFLNPKSVAVIGATERPGSWGSYIMQGLLSRRYPGKIFPINRHADHIYGIPTFRNVAEVDEPIDLAVLTIPEHSVEKAVAGKRAAVAIRLLSNRERVDEITRMFGDASSKKGREHARDLVKGAV